MKSLFLNETMFQHKNSILVLVVVFLWIFFPSSVHASHKRFFNVQAVDTMKYSRDMARDQGKTEEFKSVIETQTKQIAGTGATHIAIATPYDDEFVPFLTEWVNSARKHNLKVWFRGNFSGWEEWFSYPRITREKHTELVIKFIAENPSLFEDGDVFSSCPECENGGPGDPRETGDVEEYRKFLISEYQATQEAFKAIDKKIIANYFSMNGDVAELIMDKDTTAQLGGIVTIDHYVLTPERLNNDINKIAEQSGGKVVLGEFGAPIPDIHGDLTEKEQEEWLSELFELISQNKNVIGVNYWTAHGSSTELWTEEDRARLAVGTVRKYFTPSNVHGVVSDNIGRKLSDVSVSIDGYSVKTSKHGRYDLVYVKTDSPLNFSKLGYASQVIASSEVSDESTNISLYPKKPSLLEYIVNFFFAILRK